METLVVGPRLSSNAANVAYRRIDALLRAYGIQHAAVRGVHTHRILREALSTPGGNNTPLEATAARIVLDEVHSGLGKLDTLMTEAGTKPEANRLLLAVKRAGIPRERPEILLEEAALAPAETENLLRIYKIQPTPQIRRLSMGAPTLRFESIDEVAETTSAVFSRLPAVRHIVIALLTALFFFTVYHFAK